MCNHLTCRLALISSWLVPVMSTDELRAAVNTLRGGVVACRHPEAAAIADATRTVKSLDVQNCGCKRCGSTAPGACWYVDCPRHKDDVDG